MKKMGARNYRSTHTDPMITFLEPPFTPRLLTTFTEKEKKKKTTTIHQKDLKLRQRRPALSHGTFLLQENGLRQSVPPSNRQVLQEPQVLRVFTACPRRNTRCSGGSTSSERGFLPSAVLNNSRMSCPVFGVHVTLLCVTSCWPPDGGKRRGRPPCMTVRTHCFLNVA